MKPSYVDELGLLVSSYAWASREDILPLAQLLDSVVSGTALYIGSGGALAVSALASALHVAKTGRLATHATPLDVHFVNPSPVFCLDKTGDYGHPQTIYMAVLLGSSQGSRPC